MKRLPIIFLLFSIVILFSCEKNPVEEYGDETMKALKRTENLGDVQSISNIKQAINAFHISNGRYPQDLDELSRFTGENLDSNKYDYNPTTGSISLK